MSPSADTAVGEHYGRARLGSAILAALRIAGKDPDALTLDDLAPVDHFHTRGKESTVELLGPEFGRMFANQVRNLEEDRVRVMMGVWDRA